MVNDKMENRRNNLTAIALEVERYQNLFFHRWQTSGSCWKSRVSTKNEDTQFNHLYQLNFFKAPMGDLLELQVRTHFLQLASSALWAH
jgi:hypothetical protein